MAMYDLSNPLQAGNFKLKVEQLVKKGAVCELTEKKERRSLPANSYLHVLLSYFGAMTGNTMEYVKQNYYKLHCNRDIFVREVDDKYMGTIRVIRSSASLDKDEFALSIERFRNWASMEAGIYLPSADEHRIIQLCQIEVEQNKEFL